MIPWRTVTLQWERETRRGYLYAGAARGAWKQAARAELAAAIGADYGQVLLDLVKAFQRIPHCILLSEALRLGYPIWLLRLSVATYRLKRVIRVGTVVSGTVVTLRGITAGLSFAT